MVAIAQREPGDDVTFGAQPVRDVDLLQHFERSSVHDGSARGVRSFDEAIDENE